MRATSTRTSPASPTPSTARIRSTPRDAGLQRTGPPVRWRLQSRGMAVTSAKRNSPLWAPDRRAATVGLLLLVTLAAFEAMGVSTAIPTLVRDLRGEALYAWVFTMMLATQVVGNVVSGRVSDRRGPAPMLVLGPVLFALGLVVAGTAGSMTQLLIGRALQGFGGGAQIVALYVMIAMVFPDRDQPAVFGALAAGWVVPSMIGPTAAGLLTQYLSWRWIFLGLAPLVLLGWVLILAVLRRLPPFEPQPSSPHRGLTPAAIAAAVGLAALSWAGDHRDLVGILVALAGFAALLPAVLVLLPRGTLLFRRGLPSVVLARGLMSAAFIGSEAFLPLVLQQVHGLTPAVAGVPLTFAAVGWWLGSWWQARFPDVSRALVMRWGFLIIMFALALVTLVAPSWGPAWLAAPAWAISGLGMGLATACTSVLVLRLSPPSDRGFNSSALQLSDLIGQSVSICLGGVLVALLGPTAGWAPLNLLLIAVCLLGAWPISRRA
ncbi:MFS transporter [Kutzneria sp. NPDC052558]|uniref:MFS transporter n=1 Tax=Kutzneria sp. NPDC052558 TaxID=3364121 RepID=UPI0037C821CF